jgi:hypothetical protein
VTVPLHNAIKVGTLQAILVSVAEERSLEVESLLENL